VQSERRLRRHFTNGGSLEDGLRILASSCLRSWRTRDQIERLSLEARKVSGRDAIRQLQSVFRVLTGWRPIGERAKALTTRQ
jgi:hypothetical protein